MRQIRQGDVFLVQVEVSPGECVEVPRDGDRIVLARGEATGHAHAILDESARLVTVGEAEELFLIVHGNGPVSLVHEEHATLSIDPGMYRVVRQREYTAESDWDWVHD
jgi:hypothetical protein